MLDDPTDDEVAELIRGVPDHCASTYTEFYCNTSTGANVNGGSDAGSPSMSDTAGTGAVSTVTHQYTSVITTGTVTVGQFISIYSGAATVAAFTARVTVVSGGSGSVWVITYSTTSIAGTEPTTGSTYKAQVGGAWKGPNAAEAFPFGYITSAATNSSTNLPRVNLKNNATYSITAAMTHANASVRFEGYSSSVGDFGRATIDGGASGASYVLLTASGALCQIAYVIFQNNGASGSADGLTLSGLGTYCLGVVVNSVRGNGFATSSSAGSELDKCEAYACNQSNTASVGGFSSGGGADYFKRSVSHDNTGSNSAGFITGVGSGSSGVYEDCIADTNGGIGFNTRCRGAFRSLKNCDSYNNTSDGIRLTSATTAALFVVENCNLVKNGGYGINRSDVIVGTVTIVRNCGFGSGTQVNTSGTSTGLTGNGEENSISYASGVTPWVDPANGDFRINLAAAQGAGDGTFTETAASYSGTVGYPDVGAAQHQETRPVIVKFAGDGGGFVG